MTDIPNQDPPADPTSLSVARSPLPGAGLFRLRRGSGFEAAKRLIFLSLLVLVMLIPLDMVEGVVQERAERKHDVATEIGDQWGPEQTIGGPILVIPYEQTETMLKPDGTSVPHLVRHYASFLPAETVMTANTEVEKRHKSIYEVLVYGVDVKLTGQFAAPDFTRWNVDPSQIIWKEASLALVLPGAHALRSIHLAIDKQPLSVDAGLLPQHPAGNGLHADLPLTGPRVIGFDIAIGLNGHDTLSMLPLSGQSDIEISSDWPNPNFVGNPLPATHDISSTGFTGRWSISHLATGIPIAWRDSDFHLDPSTVMAVGVGLTEPGDVHQQTDRIVKYGILVVGLTFGTIFIIGLLKNQRVHLVQYLLIGISISLFYLLLLSLAEQMPFSWAYLIASIVDIAIVAWYAGMTIRPLIGGLTGLLLSGVHLYLYVLLQMESYALLAGTIGLLIILLLVMIATRKVDWYAIGEEPILPQAIA
jgi:inner membrane protein